MTRGARWAKHAYCINVSRKESQNKLTFRNVHMEKKAEGTIISIFIISELLMAALFSADFLLYLAEAKVCYSFQYDQNAKTAVPLVLIHILILWYIEGAWIRSYPC